MITFNPPPRLKGTQDQQIEQLYKYLYSLYEKLNMLADDVETQNNKK